MTHRDLALAYLRAFCAADIGALRPLPAADLRFAGPPHRFSRCSGSTSSPECR